MRRFLPILFVVGLIVSCTTPKNEPQEVEETFVFVEGHTPVWENAIGQVKALVDSMPADQLSYKPHENIRTFAEQIVHIATSSKMIASMFLKDTRPEGQEEIDAATLSKEELKELVDNELSETLEIMSSMSDQALQETITSFGGNEMSRLEGLLMVHDHLTNHKAKANLYIRVSGNNPPAYGYY